MPSSLLTAVEATALAQAVRMSVALTASLSAVHAVGFTLIMGGALLSHLRLLGALLTQRPAHEIVSLGTRTISVGLAINVVTGLVLFASRASAAAANGTFRLKMLLLVASVAVHFLLLMPTTHRQTIQPVARYVVGAVGLSLWLGLALTACAYILLE
jgi:hypothetical protein